MGEQLAARYLTDSAIPNQVSPVTAVNVGNSSQSISELANSAGNYQMGNVNANKCITFVCGNATSQPSVNSMSESAIVNVISDVFANNPSIHEFNLHNIHENGKQKVLHFLHQLNKYYRTKKVPESLNLPLAMLAITDPIANSWFTTVYSGLNGYEYFKTLFKFFLLNSLNQSVRCSITMINFSDKMSNP